MANPCAWPRGVQARGDRHISALNPQKFPLCLPAGGGLGEASCLGPCKASTGGTRGWDRSRIHVAVVPRGCVPPSLSPGCGDISCPAGKDANPKARGCVLTPPQSAAQTLRPDTPSPNGDPSTHYGHPTFLLQDPPHPTWWSPRCSGAGPQVLCIPKPCKPPQNSTNHCQARRYPSYKWGFWCGYPKTTVPHPPPAPKGAMVSPSPSNPCTGSPGCFQALADRCHLGSNLGWICPEMG